MRDGKIGFHAPGLGGVAGGEFAPEGFSEALRVGQHDAEHFAAADQAIVPAEIVVEHEFEGFGPAGLERAQREPLRFGFETAAAEGAFDFAVGIEERLGTDLLRTRSLCAGDDAEGDGFAVARGVGEGLEDGIGHGWKLAYR